MRRHALWLLSATAMSGCANFWSWQTVPQRQVHNQPEVLSRSQPVLNANEYQVRQGDTMYSIAFRHSLDYRELARWNSIGDDYLIVPGQVLRLSTPESVALRTGDIVAQPDLAGVSEVSRPVALPSETMGSAVSQDAAPIVLPRAPAVPVAVAPPLPPAASPVPASASAPTDVALQQPATSGLGGGRSGWQWPTEGVVVRGFNPSAGSKGLDFAGQLGQPVVAAAAGKVVYSGSALKGYGELIILKHDDLRLSAYGYNRSRLVKEGDMVRAGQHIAELGLGPENKPILHFEIRERGQPVNPVPYLPARTVRR